MQRALALARQAQEQGEVPVGAVVVLGGQVIGEGWNRPIATQDPRRMRKSSLCAPRRPGRKNYRLEAATLYATLEPCAMCIGAAMNARVARVVFGAWDLRRAPAAA